MGITQKDRESAERMGLEIDESSTLEEDENTAMDVSGAHQVAPAPPAEPGGDGDDGKPETENSDAVPVLRRRKRNR